MKTLKTLIKAPLLVNCGYGVHSRSILNALLKDEMFDLYVENVPWGQCSFLTEESDTKSQVIDGIRKLLMARHQKQDQFDLFVHVTIPNEFERLGAFNIGVTAGIETDKVSHVWVQKCNEMDLIIVPSEHSKNVLLDTIVDWKNPQTGESGTMTVTTPVLVCPEGFDGSIFKDYRHGEELPKSFLLFHDRLQLEADFNFLHVGQWGKGGFGEDRKNIANMLKYFIETFRGRKDVGLVLKTNMAKNNVMDLEMVEKRLADIKRNFKEEDIPPIYLLHGNLTDEEMSALYNHPKIKAFVSFAHGEGFGLPLLEAAACGLPVVATNWSGHLDFLNKGKFSAVDYDLQPIPEVAHWENIMIEGSRWAVVKEEDAKRRLKKMVDAHSKPRMWAKDLSKVMHEEFEEEVVQQQFTDTVKMVLSSKGAEKGAVSPVEHLKKVIDDMDEDFNVLYSIQGAAGDVFISTAVIDGLMKELPENAKIYFATNPQYADILRNNKHIHKIIPWHQFMMDVPQLEEVFDLVLTPGHDTQFLFSNYTRRGQGRLLAEQYANHCICNLGEYFLEKEPLNDIELPEMYMTIHPGSGKEQHSARNYIEWPELLVNLKNMYPELKVVQVGEEDEPEFDVDVDLRGKTNVHQLATILDKAALHLGIDSFPMHLASSLATPLVALFGSSYANSSGPWVKDREKAKMILLEAEKRLGCTRACYKFSCAKNAAMPCVNEIDPLSVFHACRILLEQYE